MADLESWLGPRYRATGQTEQRRRRAQVAATAGREREGRKGQQGPAGLRLVTQQRAAASHLQPILSAPACAAFTRRRGSIAGLCPRAMPALGRPPSPATPRGAVPAAASWGGEPTPRRPGQQPGILSSRPRATADACLWARLSQQRRLGIAWLCFCGLQVQAALAGLLVPARVSMMIPYNGSAAIRRRPSRLSRASHSSRQTQGWLPGLME